MKLPALLFVATLLACVPSASSKPKRRHHPQFIRTFTSYFPSIQPSDDVFTPGSAGNFQAIGELQTQLREFFQEGVKQLLSVRVHAVFPANETANLTAPGSLGANVTVIVDWYLNKAAGGELARVLIDLGQHGVTVNGTTSRDNVVVYGGVVVSSGMSECEVRGKLDPCYQGKVCRVDDGVPVCEDKEMRRIEKYVIIGVVCLVFAVVLVVARNVWMRRTRREENYQNFESM